MSGRIFVCSHAYLENSMSKLQEIFCTCYGQRSGPPLTTMYFEFCGDFVFPHSGANGPESKTTRIMSFNSPGGSTGNEVIVCDYRLVLF